MSNEPTPKGASAKNESVAASLSKNQRDVLLALVAEPATESSPHEVDRRIGDALARRGLMAYCKGGVDRWWMFGFPTPLGHAVAHEIHRQARARALLARTKETTDGE